MNFFLGGGSKGRRSCPFSFPPEKDSILKDLSSYGTAHTHPPPLPSPAERRSVLVPPAVDGRRFNPVRRGLCRDIIWKVRRSREAHPVRWTNWPINQPPVYLLSTVGPLDFIGGLSGLLKVYTRPESNFERRHLDRSEKFTIRAVPVVFRPKTLFRAIPAFQLRYLFSLFFSFLSTFLFQCFDANFNLASWFLSFGKNCMLFE